METIRGDGEHGLLHYSSRETGFLHPRNFARRIYSSQVLFLSLYICIVSANSELFVHTLTLICLITLLTIQRPGLQILLNSMTSSKFNMIEDDHQVVK